MNIVGSFRRLRGFSVCVMCSSASDLLLPRVFDVRAAAASSPGSTATGASGGLMGVTSTLEGAWERVGCEVFDNKFGVLL
jgi:hypothetical protein